MQDVEEREERLSERAPSDQKGDRNADQERDAVCDKEAIGGVDNRADKYAPRYGVKVSARDQERYDRARYRNDSP